MTYENNFNPIIIQTTKYFTVKVGSHKYCFFLILEDSYQVETASFSTLDRQLERFAWKLSDNAVVVKPFIRTHGLLIINEDFSKFNSQK